MSEVRDAINQMMHIARMLIEDITKTASDIAHICETMNEGCLAELRLHEQNEHIVEDFDETFNGMCGKIDSSNQIQVDAFDSLLTLHSLITKKWQEAVSEVAKVKRKFGMR
jgi:predicted phage tail protein